MNCRPYVRFLSTDADSDLQLSNERLKTAFKHFNQIVIQNITPNVLTVAGYLFQHQIIDENYYVELFDASTTNRQKSTQLIANLHNNNNPETFVRLRLALKADQSCTWLVKIIDDKYKETVKCTDELDEANCHRSTPTPYEYAEGIIMQLICRHVSCETLSFNCADKVLVIALNFNDMAKCKHHARYSLRYDHRARSGSTQPQPVKLCLFF